MKQNGKRLGALVLAALLSVSLLPPVSAAELSASFDETYYATLDYYGGLTDGSVVKSYRTNGQTSITDYGVYDGINNLTDVTSPTVGEGTVTFQLGQDAPDKFYFEGKTSRPFEALPWTISLSYRLNGAPILAEELGGKVGLVEIDLDILPNPNASEYSLNNLVLTIATAFRDDDITSLEAPGAELQLIGNLRTVLFAVLPGEEQHFSIRVGTQDFSFSGLVLLAVPATLQQLEQIADLREAKETVEDSYHAINDSLDVILNSLDGMSGSLNATANGLEQLNQARGTISAGKGQVYDSLDVALDAAGPLVDSLAPMADHLSTAQQALSDANSLLNQMSDNLTSLKPEVENSRKLLQTLQSDLGSLQDLLDHMEDDVPVGSLRQVSQNLSRDFKALGSSVSSLGSSMNSIKQELAALQEQAGLLDPTSDLEYVTIQGKRVEEIESALPKAEQLRQAYEGSGLSQFLNFSDFISLYLIYTNSEQLQTLYAEKGGFSGFAQDYLAGQAGIDLTNSAYQQVTSQAAELAKLWALSQADGFSDQLSSAKKVNHLLGTYHITVSQLVATVDSLAPTGSQLAGQLADLCSSLDQKHLSGDLKALTDLADDALMVAEDYEGTLSSSMDTLCSAAELAQRVSQNVDTALTQTQALTDLINTYHPEVQQALSDAQTFTRSASTGISALVDAAKATEALAKESGASLDQGAQQTLSGLSAALRQSTKGLGQTGTIRNAKDTIDALITDEWDSHTGGDNNLLLMDATAVPHSLTSEQNAAPSSIQYIMRTQEIKVEEAETQSAPQTAQKDTGTLWSRIAAMFLDLWNFLTGLFH